MTGPQLPAPFGHAVQLGFAVANLDDALRVWTGSLGVGPFYRPTSPQKVQARYRGQATTPELRLAWAFNGENQVALIEQINEAPSPYLEFRRAGRAGLEHLGFWTEDIERDSRRLAEAGLEPFYEVGEVSDQVRYFDARAGMGINVSLLPRTVARDRLYARLKAWNAGWDGSDPVRDRLDPALESDRK